MRHIVRIVLPLALGAIGLLLWWLGEKPVLVTVASVGRGRVEATVSNTRVGTLKACRRAQLAAQAGGIITELPVHEGDRVQAGQLLLRIWDGDLAAQLELAQREEVAARLRVVEACTAAAGAGREASRLQRMKTPKLVSEERVDIAATDAASKRAGCQAAEANRDAAAARIHVAQKGLERTILHAPFAGVVAEVNVELGEILTPAPPGLRMLPAVDLLDTSCLYVSAPIDEVDAPKVRLGAKACVRLDAFPEPRCGATVRRVAPYVIDTEKQARTVEVEVEMTQGPNAADLLPGYSADIEVILDTREGVLRIPTQAVLGGGRVLVLDPASNRLIERPFTSGIANFNFTEVLGGLREGERIITSVGREGVKAGALAAAEEETPPLSATSGK